LRVGEEAFLEREVYERAADAIGRVVLCLLVVTLYEPFTDQGRTSGVVDPFLCSGSRSM